MSRLLLRVARHALHRNIRHVRYGSHTTKGKASNNLSFHDPETPWKDEDYDHILQYPIRYPGYSPDPWTHGLDVEKAQTALPPHLQADPMNVLQEESADLDIVGRALELYVARLHQTTSSRQEVREAIQESRAGSRTLLWFLQQRTSHDIVLQPRLKQSLVHTLCAEGSNEHVWKWMRSDLLGQQLAGLNPHQKASYRGVLLRAMAEGSTFWAPRENDISEGIKLLFRAIEVVQSKTEIEHAMRSGMHIPKYAAGNWIVLQMVRSKNHSVSASLYDEFMRRLPTFCEAATQPQMIADLMLHHPTACDPLPALEFFRQCQSMPEHPAVKDLFNPDSPRKFSSSSGP